MKAAPISNRMKVKIGKFAANNPGAKMTDIAKEFNVTYNQVVHALKLYREGKLHKRRPRVKHQNIEAILVEKSTEDIIDEQYKYCAAQLQTQATIAVDDRISMLDKLVAMRKTLQTVKLEGHIKRTDAGIIALLVRKFEPEASDEDVVKYYREALELWKANSK